MRPNKALQSTPSRSAAGLADGQLAVDHNQ